MSSYSELDKANKIYKHIEDKLSIDIESSTNLKLVAYEFKISRKESRVDMSVALEGATLMLKGELIQVLHKVYTVPKGLLKGKLYIFKINNQSKSVPKCFRFTNGMRFVADNYYEVK